MIFDETKESLVSYYILPFIEISYKIFGKYFIDATINRDLDVIFVTLFTGCKEEFWKNRFYQTDYTELNKNIVIFRIPKMFENDVKLFSLGKYSEMSVKAKRRIYKFSGLLYKKQIDNVIVTAKILLALTKSSILKDWIKKEFKLTIGKNVELIKLKNKDIIYYD